MRAGSAGQRGFTLLAVLAAMTLLALATQAVVTVLAQQAQREREERLLRTGEEIASAIGSYFMASPFSDKKFPASLSELEEDTRFVGIRRHLRRVPTDPIAGSTDWGLVLRADGGIEGVYSKAPGEPVASLHGTRYADWRFVFTPPRLGF